MFCFSGRGSGPAPSPVPGHPHHVNASGPGHGQVQGHPSDAGQFSEVFCYYFIIMVSGFPQRLENLENKNGNRKVMEHVKLAKSHGIL